MTDEVRHTIFNAYHLNGELTTLLVALVEDQIIFMGDNCSFVKSPASLSEPNLFAFNLNTTFLVYGLIDSGSLRLPQHQVLRDTREDMLTLLQLLQTLRWHYAHCAP